MASKNAPAAHQKYLAVLIDADNAPALIVEDIFSFNFLSAPEKFTAGHEVDIGKKTIIPMLKFI